MPNRFVQICLLLLSASVSLPTTAADNLRILLTNDDGFDSPGIRAIHSALTAAGHNVYLIAPASQQSGASASVTSGGVSITPHANNVWAVQGRPADAVRVGLGHIMFNNPPHLVVSGANFGQNTGQDVYLSGTVGAATTAYKLGVPAIAISVGIKLEEAADRFPSTQAAFNGAANTLVKVIQNLNIENMPGVLNINYPAELPMDVRGVRWSKLSTHSILSSRYRLNAEGKYAPDFIFPHPNARKNDAESLVDGFVTLTYLDGDMEVNANRKQKNIAQDILVRKSKRDAFQSTSRATVDQSSTDAAKPASHTASTTSRPKTVIIKQRADKQSATRLPGVEGKAQSNVTQNNVTHISVNNDLRKPDPAIQIPTGPSEQLTTGEHTLPNAMQPTAAQQPVTDDYHTVNSESGGYDRENDKLQNDESAYTDPKRKPDSWLRRIFKPSEWRR